MSRYRYLFIFVVMKDITCKVCERKYNGRKGSFFCCLSCKSKWYRSKAVKISRYDVVYLAKKVQNLEINGNSIAEKYLSKEDAELWKGSS